MSSARGLWRLFQARRCPGRAVPPGRDGALALGYEEARKPNPRLVYCSITGYGQQGPRARRPGTISTTSATPGYWPCSRARPTARWCRRRWSPTLPAAASRPFSTSSWRCASATRPGRGAHRHRHGGCQCSTFAWYALAVGQATGRYLPPPSSGSTARLAALPALPDRRRRARGLRGARTEILGRLHSGNCAARPRQRPRRPGRHRAAVAAVVAGKTADRWAAAAGRGRLLRHDRVDRRWRRRSPTRISSDVGCSPTASPARAAKPCSRRCRCQSRRPFRRPAAKAAPGLGSDSDDIPCQREMTFLRIVISLYPIHWSMIFSENRCPLFGSARHNASPRMRRGCRRLA